MACSSGQEIAASETLLASTYAVVPDAVISNVNCQIDYENESAKHVLVLDKFGTCWDDKLTRAAFFNKDLQGRGVGSQLPLESLIKN